MGGDKYGISGVVVGRGGKGDSRGEGQGMVGGRGGTDLDETQHLLLHDGGRVVLHGRGMIGGAEGDTEGREGGW